MTLRTQELQVNYMRLWHTSTKACRLSTISQYLLEPSFDTTNGPVVELEAYLSPQWRLNRPLPSGCEFAVVHGMHTTSLPGGYRRIGGAQGAHLSRSITTLPQTQGHAMSPQPDPFAGPFSQTKLGCSARRCLQYLRTQPS